MSTPSGKSATEPLAIIADEAIEPKIIEDANPMLYLIRELVDDVALAIEQKLGSIAAIRSAGGEYVDSKVIRQNMLLHEAAASAIATILNHPKLRPLES